MCWLVYHILRQITNQISEVECPCIPKDTLTIEIHPLFAIFELFIFLMTNILREIYYIFVKNTPCYLSQNAVTIGFGSSDTMDLMTVIMVILNMLRYFIVHTLIPKLVDWLVFDPIKIWVEQQLGNGGEDRGVNAGDSDERHNTTAVV